MKERTMCLFPKYHQQLVQTADWESFNNGIPPQFQFHNFSNWFSDPMGTVVGVADILKKLKLVITKHCKVISCKIVELEKIIACIAKSEGFCFKDVIGEGTVAHNMMFDLFLILIQELLELFVKVQWVGKKLW